MSPIAITRTDFCSPDLSTLVVATLVFVFPLLLGGIATSRLLRERRRRSRRPEELGYWSTVLGVYVGLWALSVAVCSPMLTRAVAGRSASAEVVAKRDWTETGKGRTYEYFSVTVRMPSGAEDTFDVRKSEHDAVARGDQVVVIVAPSPGGEVLEPGPSLHSAPAVIGFVIWTLSAFLLRRKRKTRAKTGAATEAHVEGSTEKEEIESPPRL